MEFSIFATLYRFSKNRFHHFSHEKNRTEIIINFIRLRRLRNDTMIANVGNERVVNQYWGDEG